MHWITLCLITAFGYAISAIIDNYNTDVLFKSRKPQAVKVINGFLYLIIAGIIAIIFGVESTPMPTILIAIASGILASIASIPYYLGLRDEEATTGTIFYQLMPVFCIIGDIFLLERSINLQQALGFAIILTSPFIIILARRRKSARKFEIKASFFFLLYVLLLTCSTLIYARAEIGKTSIMTLFFWFVIGRASFDILATLIMPSWRKRLKQVRKEFPIKLFIFIPATLIITMAADFALRLSFRETNTSIATAFSNASELIFTFILGIVLTVIWPNFGREKLNRHIVLSHLLAIAIIVIGIILTQI